jgi:hypothetical protein
LIARSRTTRRGGVAASGHRRRKAGR